MKDQAPFCEYVPSITPIEYEEYCMKFLNAYAEREKLTDFKIEHNVTLPGDDGTYQIDIYASFTALGTKFNVICECKRYASPVTREKVVILADKVKSLGAHKGILLSTSGYQSGAVQYAKKHGIALYQIYDKYFKCHSFSGAEEMARSEYILHSLDRLRPKYFISEWMNSFVMGEEIYPTEEMKKEWYETVLKNLPEQYRRSKNA